MKQKWRKVKKSEEKWRKWRKVKKNEETWKQKWRKMKNNGLQNKDFYPHAIWDAWYTHRWHMERNLGFVATFLHFFHFSPQFWRVEKNKEKWRKWRKKRKVKKIKENEENEEELSKMRKKSEKWGNMKKQEEK